MFKKSQEAWVLGSTAKQFNRHALGIARDLCVARGIEKNGVVFSPLFFGVGRAVRILMV
ncbi:MAG: hypothetical protein ACU83U_14605 [Gammaproteobacteria bacterium]